MKLVIASVAIGLAALVAAPAASAAPAAHSKVQTVKAPPLIQTNKPCVIEDEPTPCVWPAGESGNGRGDSFLVDAKGRVKYISNKRATQLVKHAPIFERVDACKIVKAVDGYDPRHLCKK